MKFTVVREDNHVIVDGEVYQVDVSALGSAIHAIQWDSVAGRGHIEYRDAPPQVITDVSPYLWIRDAWQVAKNEAAAKAADPFYGLTVAQAKILKGRQILDAAEAAKDADYQDGINRLSPSGLQKVRDIFQRALIASMETDTGWSVDVILANKEPDGTIKRVTLNAFQVLTKARDIFDRNEAINQAAVDLYNKIVLMNDVNSIRDEPIPFGG